MRQEKLWASAIAGLWICQVLAGAVIYRFPPFEYIPPLLGVVMLIIAIWRLRMGLPSRSAMWASIIVVSAITLSALQLIPLPPEIWTQMPGRKVVLDGLSVIGQTPGWMALSLTPQDTISYFVYSIPAIALFFACLSLEANSRRPIIISIILLALVSSLLGLAQKAGQATDLLRLFENLGGMGFFANRNFHGILLVASIPMMAALSFAEITTKTIHTAINAIFAIIFLAIILIGIGSTTSRSAIVLAMAAIFLTAMMMWRREIQDERKMGFTLKFIAFAVLLLAAAQFGLAGISRLAEVDKLADGRAIMATHAIAALKEFFPFGSGFGSFVPVYAKNEIPDVMLSGYVNHAHNDWIELILEGGAPMAVIMVAFLVWFSFASFTAWRQRADAIGSFSLRASAIVIILLLAHSSSDYPLRTRALLALFAICSGFLAYGPAPKVRRQVRRPVPINRTELPIAPLPQNQPNARGSYFVKKDNLPS